MYGNHSSKLCIRLNKEFVSNLCQFKDVFHVLFVSEGGEAGCYGDNIRKSDRQERLAVLILKTFVMQVIVYVIMLCSRAICLCKDACHGILQ